MGLCWRNAAAVGPLHPAANCPPPPALAPTRLPRTDAAPACWHGAPAVAQQLPGPRPRWRVAAAATATATGS